MSRQFTLFPLYLGLVAGQCPPPPPPPPNCNNCIELDERNPKVPPGTIRCVGAASMMQISNLDLGRDATLIVCGALHVLGDLNLNANGSTIIVAAAGSLNVSGSTNLNSQTSMLNYGHTDISNHI